MSVKVGFLKTFFFSLTITKFENIFNLRSMYHLLHIYCNNKKLLRIKLKKRRNYSIRTNINYPGCLPIKSVKLMSHFETGCKNLPAGGRDGCWGPPLIGCPCTGWGATATLPIPNISWICFAVKSLVPRKT